MAPLERPSLSDPVRVRFAPSPSGYLHVGGARTALFNWLFARHHGGKFVLRVEDTDAKRSSIDSIQAIIESMRWLGLDWDEGPDVGGPVGPYFQSERDAGYQSAARQLVESGMAYPCFCTEQELDRVREEQQKAGQPVRYNGRCRELSQAEREAFAREGRPSALRFRMACETITVPDLVKGPVDFDGALYGDQVILRSNGQAMYNFACVVDDTRMGITHVVRGDEHLANTPKQMLLYRALGLEAPAFAHIPMILGKDREKLSKRHGHTSVSEYARAGYLPEGMVNYLALLGWSPGDDTELFTRDDLVRRFTTDGVARNPAVFDGTKLNWLNQQHIKKKSPQELAKLVEPHCLEAFGRVLPHDDVDRARFEEMVGFVGESLVLLADVSTQMKVFYEKEASPDAAALDLLRKVPTADRLLERLGQELGSVEPWTHEAIKGVVNRLGQELALKGKNLFQPIRVGTTGHAQGADLVTIVRLLGRERVRANLSRVRSFLGTGQA